MSTDTIGNGIYAKDTPGARTRKDGVQFRRI